MVSIFLFFPDFASFHIFCQKFVAMMWVLRPYIYLGVIAELVLSVCFTTLFRSNSLLSRAEVGSFAMRAIYPIAV